MMSWAKNNQHIFREKYLGLSYLTLRSNRLNPGRSVIRHFKLITKDSGLGLPPIFLKSTTSSPFHQVGGVYRDRPERSPQLVAAAVLKQNQTAPSGELQPKKILMKAAWIQKQLSASPTSSTTCNIISNVSSTWRAKLISWGCMP